MAGTIGIKIANGDFYPIVEENTNAKKRLVLTTAHDRQENVQVDLFRSLSKSMLDAQYIGNVVVENIRPRPKGDPSIEMVIASDEHGNISAEAYDLDINTDSEHSTLNVSLNTVDATVQDDSFFDFDLESAGTQTPSGLYGRVEEKEEKWKFPWLIMGLATVFVIIVIVLLWFYLLGGRDALASRSSRQPPSSVGRIEPMPPPVASPPQGQPPASIPAPTAPPVIQAPTAPPSPRPQEVRVRPPAPVRSYRVPAVIPRNGVLYRIDWGDTLWDISAAFYRTPWYYPRIARYNGIRNPDYIRAGFSIRIPPLN